MADSNAAGLAKGKTCQIEDAVQMLDELAANHGFRPTVLGHYLALLEEDADCQFDIYATPRSTQRPANLRRTR